MKTNQNYITQGQNALDLPENNFVHRIINKSMGVVEIPEQIMCFHVYLGGVLSPSNIDTIWFQIPPETIEESKSANYTPHEVLGRFEPIRMYAGSRPTAINFKISYIWLNNNPGHFSSWQQMKINILKLKGLTFPTRMNKVINQVSSTELGKIGTITPPPIIKFTFGDLFRNVDCIVTNVGITYSSPWNDNVQVALPGQAAGGSPLDFVSRLFSLPTPNISMAPTKIDVTDSEKVFPFRTDISINLETAYPLGSYMTYQDIVGATNIRSAELVGKATVSPLVDTTPHKMSNELDASIAAQDEVSRN